MTENMTNRGTVSQNGWSVISESYTKRWEIGGRELELRRGPAGFVLAHWVWYFNNNIEPIIMGYDDWGWALRRIGGSDEWSNHSSGTAVDLNADKHPQGRRGTFSDALTDKIRSRLSMRYDSLIKWGGDFRTTPDEMHYEIDGAYPDIKALADVLENSNIGKELLKL